MLGLVHFLSREIAGIVVKPGVRSAAIGGEDVPLNRLDRVGRQTLASGEHAGNAILRDRIAVLGGDEDPVGADLGILGYAVAAIDHACR